MKMKKIATKFSAIALMALALTSCNKKANVAPEADKEFQSAVDASAAAMIVTDIDMIVAQASEYSYMSFYSTFTSTTTNVATLNRDTTNNINTITFNNSIGADGKVRNGKILVDYTKCSTGTITAGGQQYIRNPNHMSVVTFVNYSVGKYRIKDSSTFKVINTTPAGYTRSVTPLSWSIIASVYLSDTTDNNASRQMDLSFNGTLTKQLTNSTSNTIHPSSNLPIVWTTTNNAKSSSAINAIVSYKGPAAGITGVTSKSTAYKFVIDDTKPLIRNFGCSPDYYINKEQHPFINGKVAFTTGDKSIRTVYYGDANGNAFCDNSGIVYIDGLSYNVDFDK